MKNNQIIATTIIVLIALGAGFFGGTKYQESQTATSMGNISQRQNGQLVGNGGQMPRGGNLPGGTQGLQPVTGEVISKDESGLTVQTQNGNKIIIIAGSTNINKTEEGTLEDVSEGDTITVFGEENSDGSVTATNIQVGINRMFAPEGI